MKFDPNEENWCEKKLQTRCLWSIISNDGNRNSFHERKGKKKKKEECKRLTYYEERAEQNKLDAERAFEDCSDTARDEVRDHFLIAIN